MYNNLHLIGCPSDYRLLDIKGSFFKGSQRDSGWDNESDSLKSLMVKGMFQPSKFIPHYPQLVWSWAFPIPISYCRYSKICHAFGRVSSTYQNLSICDICDSFQQSSSSVLDHTPNWFSRDSLTCTSCLNDYWKALGILAEGFRWKLEMTKFRSYCCFIFNNYRRF